MYRRCEAAAGAGDWQFGAPTPIFVAARAPADQARVSNHERGEVLRLSIALVVIAIGLGGYLATTEAITSDRNAEAERDATAYGVRVQAVLAQAGAVVAGLGNELAAERAPSESIFKTLADATAGGVGLNDAVWAQRVPLAERQRYERAIGSPIVRITKAGPQTAGRASSYIPATFTTGSEADLPRGVDLSASPVLLASINDATLIFSVSASGFGSLGDERGFFILEEVTFGAREGYLVVFVPEGWIVFELAVDPRQLAISLGGHRVEGGLRTAPVSRQGFQALGQPWGVEVGATPATQLQGLLPWFALGWPPAVALVVLVVLYALTRSRRAERDLRRFFELSLEMLCVAGPDGHIKRVNPAFERNLGFASRELESRHYVDLAHPDDRRTTLDAAEELTSGRETSEFENRCLRSDGSARWLQWSARSAPADGLLYLAARDITDRKQLEQEQAGLRRVATAVARGGSASDIFAATVTELHAVVGADGTMLMRYEADGTGTILAARGERSVFDAGSRFSLIGDSPSTEVRRTGRTARIDDFVNASGPIAKGLVESGLRSGAAAPIVVEGRLWGAMSVTWAQRPAPRDAEDRVAQFTDLVGIALANAESRGELLSSRARIVTTADQTRRRIERDLHDGVQQRLVTMTMKLRELEASMEQHSAVKRELGDIAGGLDGALDELRETARGVHPVVLSRGGLGPALNALGRRSPVPVECDVRTRARLSEPVEVAAYYVVAEALTNAAKHAQASYVKVAVELVDGTLRVSVDDDGVGGANPARGSGLVGLTDRVEALGGRLILHSSPARGTRLQVELPASDS
jgi:PAS domain S-box-containing protein